MRIKFILVFIAATLLPTAAILWMSIALIEHSLSYIGTDDLDRLSRSMQAIAREYYRSSCADLKRDAQAGLITGKSIKPDKSAAVAIQRFWESTDSDRCELSGRDGSQIDYMLRRGAQVIVFTRPLNGIRMEVLTHQYRQARMQVGNMQQRDLRRGLLYTLISLSAAVWILALAAIVYLANRISRPITDLTAGLHRLAGGDFEARLRSKSTDEIGRAIEAFNHTAEQLRRNRDRLVYLTQIASWQTLARKMAHELKNSLTPIRLTVEEILARTPPENRAFQEKAAQIVIDEVESLERRVHAFSAFASEPHLNPSQIDLMALVKERIRFLEVGHPDVHYEHMEKSPLPTAFVDVDQVKGIITNLLENAAEAAGSDGIVRTITDSDRGRPVIEVHDSGPGVSEEARHSLFEPSISFKKNGMGLGLSISRKNALLAGGDLSLIDGILGGAGFRLVLPAGGEKN